MLKFAGEDSIEVCKTFHFPEGDEKKVEKVREQFERYYNPRKSIVFEKHEKTEKVDKFITQLKNKVKSCEYLAVMVRDRFVFSVKDLRG